MGVKVHKPRPKPHRPRGPVRGTLQARPRRTLGTVKGTPDVPAHIRGNGMRGAWQKGFNAARAGLELTANPYNYGKTGEAVTYERGMWSMWRDGWLDGEIRVNHP